MRNILIGIMKKIETGMHNIGEDMIRKIYETAGKINILRTEIIHGITNGKEINMTTATMEIAATAVIMVTMVIMGTGVISTEIDDNCRNNLIKQSLGFQIKDAPP